MTLILPGNEALVAQIVDKLQVGLPAVIDRLNDDATALLTLDQVQDDDVLDYIPAPSELTRFPTVAVMEGDGTLTDDVGWGATGEHGFVVIVFFQHPDQQTLARTLRRYRRAVASTLWDGRSIGSAWGIRDLRYRAGPTLGRGDPQTWLSFTEIGFTAMAEENGL